MNDFTKEELIDIYDALMDTQISIFENLPSKIQSMIDNYCEHDNVKSLSDADYVYRCSDCDKIVGYK